MNGNDMITRRGFTAGVLLTLWLARIGEAIVVRRFGYDAARARIERVPASTQGTLSAKTSERAFIPAPATRPAARRSRRDVAPVRDRRPRG